MNTRHIEEQGEPIHCLIKIEIGAGHGRSPELLKQEARDLVLFSVNPGPHRRISHSSICEVDGKRLRTLGPATDFNRVGNVEIYFYSSWESLCIIASGSFAALVYSLPFHALSASCWLSRFSPVAPHFGQTPWNCLPGDWLNLTPGFSAERAKPSIEQLSPRHHDFHRHTPYRSDSVASGSLRLGIQKWSELHQWFGGRMSFTGKPTPNRRLWDADPSAILPPLKPALVCLACQNALQWVVGRKGK